VKRKEKRKKKRPNENENSRRVICSPQGRKEGTVRDRSGRDVTRGTISGVGQRAGEGGGEKKKNKNGEIKKKNKKKKKKKINLLNPGTPKETVGDGGR